MARHHFVLLFFVLMLGLGLLGACAPSSTSSSGGGGDSCGGCNCAFGCGQLAKCSVGPPSTGCHTNICCCTGAANCNACSCT